MVDVLQEQIPVNKKQVPTFLTFFSLRYLCFTTESGWWNEKSPGPRLVPGRPGWNVDETREWVTPEAMSLVTAASDWSSPVGVSRC